MDQMLFFYLCLIGLVASTVVFDTSREYEITKLINGERARHNPEANWSTTMDHLTVISYNYLLADGLERWVQLKGPEWFYEKSDKYYEYIPLIDRNRTINGNYLMKEPVFHWFDQRGYRHLFHDSLGPRKDIIDVLKFRTRQSQCLIDDCDYSKSENYYFECLKKDPVMINKKKCSYAAFYLPWMRNPRLKDIACVVIHVRKPWMPPKHRRAFFCYGSFGLGSPG